MISLDYLDSLSLAAWLTYEKIVTFQEKFWFKIPVCWNTKTKRATPRTVLQCLPYLLITAAQIPIFIYSWLVFIWQVNPQWADTRYPFFAALIVSYGCLLNFFLTNCGVAAFFKRHGWCLCLNVVGRHRFIGGMYTKKTNNSWTCKPIWKKYTPLDVFSDVIFCGLLSLGTCGFILPVLVDYDPIYYMFIDVPKGSIEWFLLKFIVRPIFWGNWSLYCMFNFFHTAIGAFYFILHGCTVVPSVPKVSQSPAPYSVVQNSLSNLTFSHKLTLQLMEAAYKEYRRFQIFIRPANDAVYAVVPIGLAGCCICSIASGLISIKGYSVLPIYVYMFFPYMFFIAMVGIAVGIPIACGVLEQSIMYKKYWLSRIRRKEVRQRLVACRPMGVGAGPFGYVKRSLPMEMLNGIVDNICTIMVTVSIT